MLPERCKQCTHYADGVCCHPNPFPGIGAILVGQPCESFDQNYDEDYEHPPHDIIWIVKPWPKPNKK